MNKETQDAINAYVKAVVAQAPPIDDERKTRLSLIFSNA